MRSTLEQAGGSVNQRGETCRCRRHRPRPQIGNATIGRQEVGIPGILHGLAIREFFSGRTSFGWPGDKTSRQPKGSVDRTLARHRCFTYRRTQRAPHRCFTHATRVAQEVYALVPCERICHSRAMSHMLPHLPQNMSARSLSPTSPVFRPYSPSLSCPTSVHSGLEYETLRDPRRSGGYTRSASPTGYPIRQP